MMRFLLFFLLFSTLISCKDKECQDSVLVLQGEIDAYRHMSQGMLQITSMLDSADVDKNMLSEISRDDTLMRDVVLGRIAGAMSYIENGNLKILEMEEEIEKMAGDNTGLKNVVSQLRRVISQKQDSLFALNARVYALEEENVALASEVWEKEREIKKKNMIINEQNKNLVLTRNELLLREKETIEAEGEAARSKVMIEATKYFEQGIKEVALADKMSGLLKKKQKQEKYQLAYDLFKKAGDLGKQEAKREMIKVKAKME